MADFNKPATTDTYANVLAYLKATISDLALGLDPANTTPTNVPTNAVRWNSANNRFEKYNGTTWAALSATFAFADLSASGTVTLSGGTANGVPYLNASKQIVTGSALTFDGTNFVNAVGGVRAGSNSGSGGALSAWGGATGATIDITPSSASGANGVTYNTSFISGGSGPHIWSIGGSEYMRLTSAGLILGGTSANSKLTIKNPSAASEQVLWNIQNASSTGSIGKLTYDQTTDAMRLINESNYSAATLEFGVGSAGTGDLKLDQSGNLGLGVTPSAWDGNQRVLQMSNGSFYAYPNGTSVLQNTYYNAGFKYVASGIAASYYSLYNGQHQWFTAPSGTAGNATTFTQSMTLDASGNLIVGATSAYSGGRFQASASRNSPTRIIADNQDSGVSALSGIDLEAYGGGWQIDVPGSSTYSNPLLFKFSGSERARFDSAGNFGLGTSSPTSFGAGAVMMTVAGSSVAGGYLAMTSNVQGQLWASETDLLVRLGARTNHPLILTTNNTERMRIASDGMITASLGNLMSIQATSQATTSGSAVDFTSIPSWVKKIKLIINNVKVSSSGNILVQLGTSSGVETTSYASQYNAFNNTPGGVAVTNGVQITGNSASTYNWNGIVEIINVSGNSWVVNGTAMTTIAAATTLFSGNKTLGAVLDRVRVTVTSGAFTAGSVNIIYE